MGNAPSTLPYGAQSGQVQATLSCDGTQGISLSNPDLFMSATAPLAGGAGQQISFSDITGSIQLPFDVAQAKQLGSTSYAIDIKYTLAVTNAIPSAFAFTDSISGTWDRTEITIPSYGGVLIPMGPVTLGSQGQISDFQIIAVSFSATYYDSQGEAVGPLEAIVADCRPVSNQPIQTGYTPIITSTFIDDSVGPEQAPSMGASGVFPITSGSSKSVFANIPIRCTQRQNKSPSNVYNLSIQATAPSFLSGGYNFSLTNVFNIVTIPSDLFVAPGSAKEGDFAAGFVDLGQDFVRQGNPSSGLGAVLTGATPARFDIARDFSEASEPGTASPLFTGRYFSIDDNEPIEFTLPQFGVLTFSDLTAGEVGTTFGLTVPRLQAFISFIAVRDDLGELIDSERIDCRSIQPYSLLRAPILAV